MIKTKNLQYVVLPILLLSLAVFPMRAHAATVEVFGIVTDSGGNRIPFYEVNAKCGTETFIVETGSVGDELGRYSVTFDNAECFTGRTVTVRGPGGTPSGTDQVDENGLAEVNLVDDSVTSAVPEFGALTGALAVAGSLGSFLLIKKKALLG